MEISLPFVCGPKGGIVRACACMCTHAHVVLFEAQQRPLNRLFGAVFYDAILVCFFGAYGCGLRFAFQGWLTRCCLFSIKLLLLCVSCLISDLQGHARVCGGRPVSAVHGGRSPLHPRADAHHRRRRRQDPSRELVTRHNVITWYYCTLQIMPLGSTVVGPQQCTCVFLPLCEVFMLFFVLSVAFVLGMPCHAMPCLFLPHTDRHFMLVCAEP